MQYCAQDDGVAATRKENMRVLHVAECLAGGVLTALEGYVKATPNLEHIVLGNSRRGHNLAMRTVAGSKQFIQLPPNHARAIRAVAKQLHELRPDVLHAHSSYAGVYARLGALGSDVPVVYTPHAISYGRPDFSPPKRALLHAVEKLLSMNTDVFAACSVHERDLLARLNSRVPVVTVPNALPLDHPARRYEWQACAGRKVVGMVGRINEYRDPERFLSIVRRVREQRADVEFEWIGDGDEEQRIRLTAAGVHVTGWLSSEELQRRITALSMLLYTSRWDGFPMVILEAITARVPTIVADIAPLRECPTRARFDDANQAAAKVLAQLDLNEPLAWYWDPLLAEHTFENQQQALMHAYELATAL